MNENEFADHAEAKRKGLQFDAALGFVGFFAGIFMLQAIVNVFQPEPKVWPALLALGFVVATVVLWRARRR